MDSATLLRVHGLNKAFAVPVLKHLNFELRAGEVHALMGSNGAGKSTLCNLICGIHTADSGDFWFNGTPYQPGSLKQTEALGICMVMQELNLFPSLSVAENLFFRQLGDRLGVVRHQQLNQAAQTALSDVGLANIDPATQLSKLGVGQQQLVEIASVLQRPLKLLVLDEPTAALTDPQIELLFAQIERLKARGVGVIYISHRMDEISRIADRVSVLRDGELIATKPVAEMDAGTLVNLMAGDLHAPQPNATSRSEPHRSALLKVERLSRRIKDHTGGDSGFEDVSLTLHAGEVLGLGGLIGSGRSELLRAIFGADIASGGGIRIASDQFSQLRRLRSPADAVKLGIGLLVEDRKSQGLFLPQSIRDNLSFGRLSSLTRGVGVIDRTGEQRLAESQQQQLAIKCDTLAQSVGSLSGGNQQKALIGRWLVQDLDILLFDEPTRGVDAHAKARIQALIRELAAAGKAVLVVSSETQELLSVSDRIMVLSNGRVAAEFEDSQISEQQLLEASFRFYQKRA